LLQASIMVCHLFS